MTESDLRVANTRLQSGGEVNPYTARHMGLFVVGRLAAQHGLVVRLRSTIAGEPNSGTTAGVFVPAELLVRGRASPTNSADPTTAHPPTPTRASTPRWRWTRTDDYSRLRRSDAAAGPSTSTATPTCPCRLLPQRNPGASGISDIPAIAGATPRPEPEDEWPAEDRGPPTRCRRRRPNPSRGRSRRPAPGRSGPPRRPSARRPTHRRSSRRAHRPPATACPRSSRCEPQPQATGSRAARTGQPRSPSLPGSSQRVADGRCRRCDLSADAVRMAGRSHRSGQERPT